MTRIAALGRLLLVLAVTAALAPLPAFAAEEEPVVRVADWADDVVIIHGEPAEDALQMAATDPLGLITGYTVTTAYTQSNDLIDVWACGSAATASEIVAQLDAEVGDYFAHHSRGRYRPVFTAKGSAGSDSSTCTNTAVDNVSNGAEASMIISPGAGGVAYNIHCGTDLCPSWPTFPGNNRIAYVGESFFSTTAAHEIGHLIQWPHSYTGNIAGGLGEYDNAMDLMSGNYGRDGGQIGSYYLPYESAVINQYAAGWIDPSEVWVVDPGGDTVTLSPTHNGTQMAVIWDGSSYYTLAARAPEAWDPIAAAWSGVEVYKVTPCTSNECLPGYRRVIPEPAVSFVWDDPSSYDSPPAHLIPGGGSRTIGGVSVSVSASGSNYTVTFGSGADPGPTGSGPGGSGTANGTFADDDTSVFEADIEWLVSAGITSGCNPPENTLFCPGDPVTRGQMAAFLHRALPGLDNSGSVPDFGDTAGSVFEGDIDWLASTGVTKGCNPPSNDLYCPGDPVTRGAMAAFLVRALGLTASNSTDFVDDNTSVFEGDIEKLATAGITLGCNPPANDRFCPDDPVTRGAMAAFLRRALG